MTPQLDKLSDRFLQAIAFFYVRKLPQIRCRQLHTSLAASSTTRQRLKA
ncbi:hypothetical protein [Sphaerothrix gracilis]